MAFAPELQAVTESVSASLDAALAALPRTPRAIEVGRVLEVGPGFAVVSGLPGVRTEELVRFACGELGLAFDLAGDHVGVLLLDHAAGIEAGSLVRRTGAVAEVPVGPGLLGRVVDAAGRPLDRLGPVRSALRRAVECDAPAVLERSAVSEPLHTGIQVVDALVPIGRGQRELVVGDRQTGKTAIVIDAIVNQVGRGVVCVYCAVGQRAAATARVIEALREHHALEQTIVVVSGGDDPPGSQFLAPYAATAMAEHFMEQGRDVLVAYDDLTRHARAYRELSLLLRRPPGREAYPGDIFFVHARLLERAAHLSQERGGGSLTALPVLETEAQDVSAYIPTNLISITDGQIYLSPRLLDRGQLPAVDVGLSVSRVGGAAQLPAYRSVVADLRLSYTQFEELERFSRYGARLEDDARRRLERGARVRQVLRQPQLTPIRPGEQIAALLATVDGAFDDIPVEDVRNAAQAVRERSRAEMDDVLTAIESGQPLDDPSRARLVALARSAAAKWRREGGG